MESQKFLEVTRELAEAGWACHGASVDTHTGDASGTGPSALPVHGHGAEHPILAGKLIFAEFELPRMMNFHTQREQQYQCYSAACQRHTHHPWKYP